MWSSVKGVAGLAKTAVEYSVAGTAFVYGKVTGKMPKWAEKRMGNAKEFAKKVWQDPFSILEGMGQGLSDTYENEGVSYLAGAFVGDYLIAKGATKAVKAMKKPKSGKVGSEVGGGKKASGANGTGNGANSPKNVGLHEKYKDVLGTTEKANPLVDSLRETGKLPDNFISKDLAIEKGWRPGKALENYVPGGQIGGDIYQNSTKLLPEVPGRVWREADVGLIGDMSRAKQPGTRLLYSNDGLLYITTDHYKTVHFIGNY